jgi:pyruvate kinase
MIMLDLASIGQTFQAAMNLAQEDRLLIDGDLVVMTAGTLQGVAGSTDLIKVEVVKSILGRGICAVQGAASGRARVGKSARELAHFNPGEILVVPSTNAHFLEMMRKASAIITEDASQGNHAAVIGQKLGIPVIVGFKNATQVIRDGTFLSLDAQRGMVYSGALINNRVYHPGVD